MIPTAEEFIYNAILKDIKSRKDAMPERFHESAAKTISGYMGPGKPNVTALAMIEFAKMHVKAALEATINNVEFTTASWASLQEGSFMEIDKDSILNAYPETNIK